VKEIPVTWQEIDGSHLNIVDASIQMARDMMLVKFLYSCRLWRYEDVSY
jgi:dolichyl-phosphate beta-glucosyltransferase